MKALVKIEVVKQETTLYLQLAEDSITANRVQLLETTSYSKYIDAAVTTAINLTKVVTVLNVMIVMTSQLL